MESHLGDILFWFRALVVFYISSKTIDSITRNHKPYNDSELNKSIGELKTKNAELVVLVAELRKTVFGRPR